LPEQIISIAMSRSPTKALRHDAITVHCAPSAVAGRTASHQRAPNLFSLGEPGLWGMDEWSALTNQMNSSFLLTLNINWILSPCRYE
jgi:hypothetical protein